MEIGVRLALLRIYDTGGGPADNQTSATGVPQERDLKAQSYLPELTAALWNLLFLNLLPQDRRSWLTSIHLLSVQPTLVSRRHALAFQGRYDTG